MREPNEQDAAGATMIARVALAIGDNEEKLVRFLTYVVRDFNVSIEEQQELSVMIQRSKRNGTYYKIRKRREDLDKNNHTSVV